MLTVTATDRTLQTSYSATIQGSQDVDIYPQISGKITQICINEGAEIKKGQTLFVIDQVPYRAVLATAKANVESALAGVANAELTLNSKKKLFDQKVVSSFDLQQAQISLRAQNAALAQARAECEKAQNDLSYTEVKSPVNGVAGMSGGSYIVRLKNWSERKGRQNSKDAVIGQIFALTADIKDAQVFAFAPPMVMGYGVTNGLEIYVQDRKGGTIEDLQSHTKEFIAALNKRPEIQSAMNNLA